MSQPSLHWPALEASPSLYRPSLPCRLLAAAMLQASRQLARAARALTLPRPQRPRPMADARLEFYAEAGAPEGALYLDGHLVGHLPGVTRL
ncbi:MAG: hypothetical protein ACK4PH_22840 [Aquincola tertiaricarbonis]|uniref:hypothetical protein n=1 Tax=Aquincola TaxID=391952 RepID=UPI000B2323F5|nr:MULTISPECIES: hypothetical protein [Aquincola]MCR5865776.1 hypothetical protein [Aquincola sp. J276]